MQCSERPCDGPAGTSPHTRLTCAAAACGVQEHHGTATNEGRGSGTTREGGGTKRSASAEREVEENNEERDGDENDKTVEKRNERETRRRNKVKGTRSLESGFSAAGEKRMRKQQTEV
ncbi:hypothetical protein NDU88_006416 [Pleurodeles waltl]|uniref:Uncharacterized protein n=1 Tax=Pleurodeles waltl TaxID=8319 RepID=A0AAV7ULF3_PLEWA|nr:hypothetical protein NDU88_006416 [Pleurodeles waltl]